MKYYVVINDKEFGPFSLEQVAGLNITAETEVWRQGMPDWQLAGDVPELAPYLRPVEHYYAPVPAPVVERPVHYRRESRPPEKPRKRGCGCMLWALFVLLALLIAMAASIPDKDDHLKALKGVSHEWVEGTVDDMGTGIAVLDDVIKKVGNTGTDIAFNHMFTYKNYFFVSVGYVNYGEGPKPVSLGVFGHVFTYSKDDIDHALSRAISKGREKKDLPEYRSGLIPESEYVHPKRKPSVLDPAIEYIDSTVNRVKDDAVQAAKDWVKQQIDEL